MERKRFGTDLGWARAIIVVVAAAAPFSHVLRGQESRKGEKVMLDPAQSHDCLQPKVLGFGIPPGTLVHKCAWCVLAQDCDILLSKQSNCGVVSGVARADFYLMFFRQ